MHLCVFVPLTFRLLAQNNSSVFQKRISKLRHFSDSPKDKTNKPLGPFPEFNSWPLTLSFSGVAIAHAGIAAGLV